MVYLSCVFSAICWLAVSKSSFASPIDPTKPSIAIVPGAWTQDDHFQPLAAKLGAKGYEVIIRTQPSFNSVNSEADSVASDADTIRQEVLLPLVNAGKDVVLFMHSYGGFPGPAAACGLSKAEVQAAGYPGGIIGMVFIAALIGREGDTLIGKLGGELLPWIAQDTYQAMSTEELIMLQFDEHQLSISDSKSLFFNDVPDEIASDWIRLTGTASNSTFYTPEGDAAWPSPLYDNRRVYLRTLQDRALPPEAQTSFIETSGVEWNVQDVNASHTAFISEPEIVATAVDNAVSAFQGAGLKPGQVLAPVESPSSDTWVTAPAGAV